MTEQALKALEEIVAESVSEEDETEETEEGFEQALQRRISASRPPELNAVERQAFVILKRSLEAQIQKLEEEFQREFSDLIELLFETYGVDRGKWGFHMSELRFVPKPKDDGEPR